MSHEGESNGLHHADLLIALSFQVTRATTARSRCAPKYSAHVLPWSTSLFARLRSDQIHCGRLLSINDRQGSCEDNTSRKSICSRGKASSKIVICQSAIGFFNRCLGCTTAQTHLLGETSELGRWSHMLLMTWDKLWLGPTFCLELVYLRLLSVRGQVLEGARPLCMFGGRGVCYERIMEVDDGR